MTFGDLNFVFIIFFILFVSISVNVNTAVHLLLTAEFLWITLYVLVVLVGYIYDNINILSLTFFFLILSAVEFGIGVLLILLQNLIFRSVNLNDSVQNNIKFYTRFKHKLNLKTVKYFMRFYREILTTLSVFYTYISGRGVSALNYKDFCEVIMTGLFWIKVRLSYSLNSWVYTTNHKRIAINYFSFVLVSGTAGMSLATVIRLEFSYPGVGVLAGDSLQYLTIVTAHGVIMVFFMIMPAIFGGFGNFLLPTQLGVHDVAFPRLNSAAFWFIPGGLIMLCQLICIDRRYQRMNCFNIRELQTMLKRRFFTDLFNFDIFRELLSESMINLRYKVHNSSNTEYDYFIYSRLKLTVTPKSRNTRFSSLYESHWLVSWFIDLLLNFVARLTYINFDTCSSFWLKYYGRPVAVVRVKPTNTFKNFLGRGLDNTYDLLLPLTGSGVIENFYIYYFTVEDFHLLIEFLCSHVINLSVGEFIYLSYRDGFRGIFSGVSFRPNLGIFTSSNLSTGIVTKSSTLSEVSNTSRFSRVSNPLISYDYKCGNYLGIWEQLYPSLILSFIEVSRGIRKSPWFYSEQFNELLCGVYTNFKIYFEGGISYDSVTIKDWYSSHVLPIDNFLNIFFCFDHNNQFLNLRWVEFTSLNQKFHNMFTSSSTQQRVLSNWRELKFSREAWRCKLLLSRHQNTLYRRYTSEEGFIWSMERNAKDLLPGWAMITPFSARTRYTAIGRTDIGLMGVLIVLNASIVSSANFLVTYRYLSTLNNRKMRDARSFFAEALITASWMMVAANPMLVIGIYMLLCDRHWQTSFFDYSGGGDTVLFQHMFWFFGHPEVYVIMLPIFGYVNTILSFYLRKRVSARGSLLYSMYTIAFLGFFVWGHHMYMVGLAHTTRMLFSTLTVMISVPAATKLMHWCVTIVNSFFVVEIPFVFMFTFIYLFVSGGVSGMHVANVGMDILLHDTFYVIGHFHIMLSGSGVMGIWGAFYFYFPAMYGVKYSRIYAYIHYVYYLLGHLMTVIPMMWLGYLGHPRRVLDYPSVFGGWHSVASAGHLLAVVAVLSFYVMMYDSIRQAKPTLRNNFGVGRFNTRLNFYLYQLNRLSYVQCKNFYNKRFTSLSILGRVNVDYIKLASFETTLLSYKFFS